jgi:hypothetical protein
VSRECANGFANNRPGRARIGMERRIGYGRPKQVRPMITDDPGHL